MKTKLNDLDSLLIWLYVEISELFSQSELPLYTMRFSPNALPYFTDAELFTCAIFAELITSRDRKSGYEYIKRHYHHWFPALPCYEIYIRKLDKFFEALAYIFKMLRRKHGHAIEPLTLIDTAPIVVCQAQHSQHARAAKPFVSKGYCPAKKMYYVGAKLQIVAQARAQKLPLPIEFSLASASIHDLEIAKETLPDSEVENADLYADKAYQDQTFQLELFEDKAITLETPVKKKKGQVHLTLFQQAANSIHSSIRQPIDALFAWIQDRTHIQYASKVRSENGLFFHVFVKMLAALILMIVEF